MVRDAYKAVKMFAGIVISTNGRNLKSQWLKISPVGRNDKNTDDVMVIDFLSCTKDVHGT